MDGWVSQLGRMVNSEYVNVKWSDSPTLQGFHKGENLVV
jgi:hypothetical protein